VAERFPNLNGPAPEPGCASDRRLEDFLKTLERMAAGDTSLRLPISETHDKLDAIAHGVNVLIGELAWTTARMFETERARVVTLQAAVAEAERSSASKSFFLRNVSHEIRTPIAAMLSFAELLSTSGLSELDRADYVHRLQVNGRAVVALLSDLLDLAKLDENRLSTLRESVPVFDLVREVLASVEIEAQAKRLQLRLDAASEAMGSLRTDRYRLRQVLVNLMANAVKFTETGSIVVSLRVARAVDGDLWTIDIADTGIGIAEDRQPYIFEPFEQARPSTDQRLGGAGLGLPLSRRLAERLGGSLVLLHSTPGVGTTFRLTLKALAGSESKSSPADAVPFPSLDGARVLVAEDHPDMRVGLQLLLEQAGASVETACDGCEAVAKGAAGTFDVVLMDLRMPRMDGCQATRALRDRGFHAPIVAITADSAPARRAEVLAAGGDACLSKPFELEDLIESIPTLRHRSRSDASAG
jgi:signal transduction histidine kinase/ActR/RegA family two-component response regulator